MFLPIKVSFSVPSKEKKKKLSYSVDGFIDRSGRNFLSLLTLLQAIICLAVLEWYVIWVK